MGIIHTFNHARSVGQPNPPIRNIMRNTLRLLAASLLGLCLYAAAANAATVSGRVQDANTKSYLYGANVTIRELDRSTGTTSGGDFFFGDVPAGTYTLLVSYMGYDDVSQSVVVSGAGASGVEISIGSEVVNMGKMVVVGEREGQARALQQKRIADSILDIVSADSAGKLPDGNAAEAVRRLPGVFAQIDQNEGRFIVVRGIDADLNNIMINGLGVGSTSGDQRGAAMDAVPADLIGRIEVVKAVTPDMDAQGIGAAINIVTPSAFDHAEPFVRGTLAGGYFDGPKSEKGKNTPYNGSISMGTQFGGGKWGIVVGGSYSFRHYISNRRSGGGQWYPAAASGEGANIYVPEGQDIYYYDVQRWRKGVNLNLEFKPNADNMFFLRTANNYFEDDEGRDRDNFEFFRTAYPASFTSTTAHFVNGRSSIEYRHYHQKHRINNYSIGGKNNFNDGKMHLDYALSLGDTGIKVPARVDWRFRTAANIASDLDFSNQTWRVTPEPKYYVMSNYPMRDLNIRTDDQYEEIQQGLLNFKVDQEFFGHPGFWQVGGRGFYHKKGWDRKNEDHIANLFNLGQYPELVLPAHEWDGGYFTMTPRINFDALDSFMAAHPNFFPLNVANSIADSYANFFRVMEEQYAGYAMAKVDINKWSILAGARLEDTKVKTTGIESATILGVVQPLTPYHASGKYTHFLPGLHVKYQQSKNLQVRFAYTNTIGRPSYGDIAARRTFSYSVDPDVPGGNTYLGSLTDGNPSLKAYESRNFDLSVEYYFHNTGIASIGVFTKYIKNPIYTYSLNARNTTFEGLNFSSLAYTKPLNADKGTVTGAEFNYQQQLTMLPAPFDGLGFGANLTVVDSSESLPTRPGEDLPFEAQSNLLYNIQLFYEKGPIQARLAYTYTGPFILDFGDTIDADDYQAKRAIIDAKVSYRINRHLTVFADVINLGREPLDEYARIPEQQSATEHYWWTANFGVNWSL